MRKFYLLMIILAGIFSSMSLKGQTVYDSLALVKPDSQQIFLSDFQERKAVVLIFTCNHCIYSKKYEDRLIETVNEFKEKGVAFLFVNPNSPKLSYDDRLELMKARAEEKAFPCPYVQDPDAALARHLGATKTPEAFVGKWEEGGFKVHYSGRIDDNPLMATRVSSHYLRDAIQFLLGEEGVTLPESMPAMGCGIKME